MTGDAKSGLGRKIARRTFLVAAGVVGGGLVVGAGAVAARLASIDRYKLPAGAGEASFGAWLRIAGDGKVEVAVPHQEMGQGIYALAVLLAAEGLRLPIDAVRAVQAPVNARFANATMLLDGLPLNEHVHDWRHDLAFWIADKAVRTVGLNGTGGSSSTRNLTEPVRACAASMLDMLTRAAAARFAVAADQLTISDGRISSPNGKSASYAELADAAAQLSPKTIALPPLAAGSYVGKGIARADVPPKTNGTAHYGIDTREPGQLYAAIRHSPRLGGMLQRAQLRQASPGVRGIVEGQDYVAVVAESYVKAAAALEKADVAWDDSKASNLSTPDVFKAYRAALDQGADYKPRWILDSAGTIGAAPGRNFKATYDAPFLAHATMEPMNATALVTDTDATIWAGHQSGHLVKLRAAGAAGVSSDAVNVVTPFLGGGFGRRADLDYVVKGVEIARKFKGTPVQTIWSRAEDLRDDFFRPAAMADVSATVDADGYPSDLVYRIAVPALLDQIVARVFPSAKGGLLPDRSTGDGAIFSFYGLKNRRVENFAVDLGIPVGFWRSVGHSLNNFFFETFIDELAAQAKIKPVDYRARLLKAADGAEATKRAADILARLARLDAENPIAPGKPGAKTGRGFALSECFHSFVGQIADVEVHGREIRVKRVYAVVDCGFAIDPPNVMAQVRSAIVYGLSAALYGKVEIDHGRIVPENFDTYPVLTLDDAPEIVVEIANSEAALGGVGEIGTPGIAPAVGNAIFAATGQRLRSLPFNL
jgi:isoquinoline 1-oxidoreductase beta subunit